MLVCSANWLLPDGSLSHPPAAFSVAAFVHTIRTIAGRAGFRRDGRYRPVDRVDLVLAGDMLDTLSSTSWLGPLRPWHASPASRRMQAAIVAKILQRERRTIASLRRLARHGVSVPEATRLGRPAREQWRAVPLRIVLLSGDHDRHLLGTERAAAAPVPWPPAACTRWGDDGTVLISHGHGFDPATACSDTDEPRPPTVHESLAIDLTTPLVCQIRDMRAFTGLRPLARRLAEAEPLEIPAALSSWLHHQPTGSAGLKQLRSLWQRAVSRWQRQARRDPPALRDLGIDILDHLASWLDAYSPGDAPPAATADLTAALTPDAATIRAHARDAGAGTVVLGHVASPFAGSRAGGDETSILGLRHRRPGHSDDLPWAVVFEQGEHAGRHHATSATEAGHPWGEFAPAVIGGASSSMVVDALRAA